MSTFTPRLQLKRNDGSDPFKRQDFTDNWNKMDAAPGTHVCTSTSRPAWGASQSGRLILETDTRCQYEWSGTSWLPILTASNAWGLGVNPNASVAKNTTVTYTLGTITTSRPGTLLIDLTGILACVDTTQQSMSLYPIVNSATISNPSPGFIQWTGSNNNGSYNVYSTTNTKGWKAVAAGTHTIQARVTVGNISTLSVLAYRLSAAIHLINESAR